MKTLNSILIVIILLPFTASANTDANDEGDYISDWGIKGGGSFSRLGTYPVDYNAGFGAGVFNVLQSNNPKLSIRTELLWLQKWKYEFRNFIDISGVYGYKHELSTVSLAPFLVYKLPSQTDVFPFLECGCELAFLIHRCNGQVMDPFEDPQFEYCLNVGAGLCNELFHVDYRYSFGLTGHERYWGNKDRTMGFQIMMGILY